MIAEIRMPLQYYITPKLFKNQELRCHWIFDLCKRIWKEKYKKKRFPFYYVSDDRKSAIEEKLYGKKFNQF